MAATVSGDEVTTARHGTGKSPVSMISRPVHQTLVPIVFQPAPVVAVEVDLERLLRTVRTVKGIENAAKAQGKAVKTDDRSLT